MKPLMSRTEDSATLQELGRASIQIVHDLKNQLNGLKLYATFLRRRLEKSERPEDEQETVSKLINGLDRAANDLSTIVQYSRKVELKKQAGVDIQKIMRAICLSLNESSSQVVCMPETEPPLTGDFDSSQLTDALKWISVVAIKHQRGDTGTRSPLESGRHEVVDEPVVVSVKLDGVEKRAVIEWSGVRHWDHDPFSSFAGSDEIRMSLAAKVVEAHDGSASCRDNSLVVTLPISV